MIAGIIGAAGYAGAELVRLLAGHPRVDGLALASVSFEGGRIEDIYLNFLGKIAAPLEKPGAVIAKSDIVFASLPHGVGEDYARASLERGVSFIDLSADFRFDHDEAAFTAWYGKPLLSVRGPASPPPQDWPMTMPIPSTPYSPTTMIATACKPLTKRIFTSSPPQRNKTPIGSSLFPPYALTTHPEKLILIYTTLSRIKIRSSLPPIPMGSFSNPVLTLKKYASPRETLPSSNAQSPVTMNYTPTNKR
jgi:hypothetical protein